MQSNRQAARCHSTATQGLQTREVLTGRLEAANSSLLNYADADARHSKSCLHAALID